MSFAALVADMNDTHFDALYEEGSFTAPGQAAVATKLLFNAATTVQGELGQVRDPRPSIRLPKAVIGAGRAGFVTYLGRKWSLDLLIDDDGYSVGFIVK